MIHWTQTPEGKKRLSAQSKASWNSGRRKDRIDTVSANLKKHLDSIVKRPVGRPSNHPSTKSVATSKAMKKYWAAKKASQVSVTRKSVANGSAITDAANKFAHDVLNARLTREFTNEEKRDIKHLMSVVDGMLL